MNYTLYFANGEMLTLTSHLKPEEFRPLYLGQTFSFKNATETFSDSKCIKVEKVDPNGLNLPFERTI